MSDAIAQVLIVGGGTSGWMSAALLSRFLPASKCAVTLVESPEIGTIGVGEATVPPLVAFLRALGVTEHEFMLGCHATYKLGIKFLDWRADGNAVWHPFGTIGGSIDHLAFFHHWLRCLRAGEEDRPYASYSLQALLGDAGKAPRSSEGPSSVTEQGSYAYHVDAGEFAALLAAYARSRGVRHLADTVKSVARDPDGRIARVDTEANGPLRADLYIDCTGFGALLIEKALEEPFEDWSEALFCDRAVVMPLALDGPMPPFTRATARSAGWIWQIPLAHRYGCGYVYASRFISDDEARRELLAYAGAGTPLGEPRRLTMRVGRRRNFWSGNCIAVGLAGGFLEPLESTGLYLVQKGLEFLLDLFPDTGMDPALARRYNAKLGAVYEELRDFIVLHYLLAGRDDTEFWKANRANAPPDSLRASLELYDGTGRVDWERNSLFHETSFYAVAAGLGRLPRRELALAAYSDLAKVRQILDTIRSRNLASAAALPDHGEYIRALHASAGRSGPGGRISPS